MHWEAMTKGSPISAGANRASHKCLLHRNSNLFDSRCFCAIKKNNRNAGRKKALSEQDLAKVQAMLRNGAKIQDIADHFGVSRKIVSQALNDRPGENFTMQIDYKQRNHICTVIYVGFLEKQVLIQNPTDDVLDRAFGVIEEPTWKDFEQFLLSRCFPQSRGYAKAILQNLDVQSCDPLEIAEATGGRTAEDNMYLIFKTYPQEVSTYAKN